MLRTKVGGHLFQDGSSLLLFLFHLYVSIERFSMCFASSRGRKPKKKSRTWPFVSQCFLSNIWELSGFLAVHISGATFAGSVLMPVLSLRSNFVVRYSLTSVGKCTASFRGLCRGHPVYKSLHWGERPVSFFSWRSSPTASGMLLI